MYTFRGQYDKKVQNQKYESKKKETVRRSIGRSVGSKCVCGDSGGHVEEIKDWIGMRLYTMLKVRSLNVIS